MADNGQSSETTISPGGVCQIERYIGQLTPGIVLNDMVLDGWHRYRACEELGQRFWSIPFQGTDPLEFVISKNLHRRHLSASQRAAAVVACNSWLERGRPKSMPDASDEFSNTEENQNTKNRQPLPILSESEMAQAAQVSERTIRQAKAAQKAGLGDAVKDGKVSGRQAAEIAKLPEQVARKSCPAYYCEYTDYCVSQVDSSKVELAAASSRSR